MKKITLLLALLMWSSNFYSQTYLDEGFEGGTFPPTGWTDIAGAGDTNNYPWASVGTYMTGSLTFTPIQGTKSAFYNQRFDISHGETPNVAKDKWLISSAMDFTSAVAPELTYYEAVRHPDFPASKGAYYSIDYAGDPDTATWVPIYTAFDFAGTPSAEEYVWKIRGAFDLSGANGNANVYIGFRYVAPAEASEWFLDGVVVRELPTCVEPSFASVPSVSATTADLSWTAGPTPPTAPTTWEIELVDITASGTPTGTPTTTGIATTTHTLTSLASGNDYEFYVRGDCTAGGKSEWSGPYAFSTPDANDECIDATILTHESNIVTSGTATANPGNVAGATDSGVPATAGPTGTPSGDVWFSFVAGYGGATIVVEPSASFDPVVELFGGTCGALTEVSANPANYADGAGNGGTETLVDDTVVNGTTYYVRVYDWNGVEPADGSFNIKVFRGSVPLQVEELEKNEFSFYPNPVQNKLNLRALKNIENVSIYNMLGQEVLRKAPNTRSSEIDMSNLQTGAYFVKVTIDGITETKQIIKR